LGPAQRLVTALLGGRFLPRPLLEQELAVLGLDDANLDVCQQLEQLGIAGIG